MRWKSEKGPALTRYDPVPPYWLVYQGPREFGGTYELHDHEALLPESDVRDLAAARKTRPSTSHMLLRPGRPSTHQSAPASRAS